MRKSTLLFIAILFSLFNIAALASTLGGEHDSCHPQVASQTTSHSQAKHEQASEYSAAIANTSHCKRAAEHHLSQHKCCTGVTGILPTAELTTETQDLSNIYTLCALTKPVTQFLEPIFKPPKNYS